jgi:hypothetical protein
VRHTYQNRGKLELQLRKVGENHKVKKVRVKLPFELKVRAKTQNPLIYFLRKHK